MQDDKIISITPEKLDNIKSIRNKKLINTVMARTKLRPDDLRLEQNVKLFAKTLTEVICETIFKNNKFGAFKYDFLVNQRGEWISGKKLLVRGIGLPTSTEIDVCKKPTSCNLNLDCESERFEEIINVKTYRVCDIINEFCYRQNWCSDASIDEFIEAIKSNLAVANQIKIEEEVEKDFNNLANFNDNMIIEIDSESSERDIVKAIRKARLKLISKNRLNLDGNLTKAIADDIYGAINQSALIDYESVLICCANSESRLGTFYTRLLPTEFNDPKIVGILYTKDWYLIRFGASRVYEQPCPDEPIWQKQFLYQQAALGPLSFFSAILIKLVSKQELADNIKSKIDNINPKEVIVDNNTQTSAELAVTELINKTIKDSLGSTLQQKTTYSDFTAPTAETDGTITAKVEIQDKKDSTTLATSTQEFKVKLKS